MNTVSKESHRQEQFDLLAEAVRKEFKCGEYGFLICLDLWKKNLDQAKSEKELHTSLYKIEPPLDSQRIFLGILRAESSLPDMQRAYSDVNKHVKAVGKVKIKKCYTEEELTCWHAYLSKY